MIRRTALFSGFAALALLAGGVGAASAGELVRAPVRTPGVQLNHAPTTQHADSFAAARRGDALSSARNDNLVIQDNTKLSGRRGAQVNLAPTTQDASSFAFAKKGDAFSDASNSNTVIQNNLGGRLQLNAAPTHQAAHSGAVAIGGSAVSSASNSNVVSQGNLK